VHSDESVANARHITVTDAIREARAAAIRIEDGARLVSRSTVPLREVRDVFEEWGRSRSSTLADSTRDLYHSGSTGTCCRRSARRRGRRT
jgi:hypothetical protein